jgi:hypothetical protein
LGGAFRSQPPIGRPFDSGGLAPPSARGEPFGHNPLGEPLRSGTALGVLIDLGQGAEVEIDDLWVVEEFLAGAGVGVAALVEDVPAMSDL